MHRILVWSCLIFGLAFSAAAQKVRVEQRALDDSIAGAVLDTPPLTLGTLGREVRVYEAAVNGRIRAAAQGGDDFARASVPRKLVYRYVPPMALVHENGQAQIEVERQTDGTERVLMRIAPAVSHDAVVAALKRSNPDVRPENVGSLEYYALEISTSGATESFQLIGDNPQPFGELLVELRFPAGGGTRFVEASRKGSLAARLRLRYQTLMKLTKNLTGSIRWTDVTSTAAYKNYLSPAGAKYVTEDQQAAITTKILSDTQFNTWREGTDDEFRAELLRYLRESLFDSKREELALDAVNQLAQYRFNRDPGSFRTDEVRRVASDAKNLNENEWCRKYNWVYAHSASSSSSVEAGGGLSIPLAELPIPIGFDAGYSSSESSSVATNQGVDQSDCGKQKAESSFKYEWEGSKWEPKSIYVHEILKSDVNRTAAVSLVDFVVRQRFAWNEQTFGVSSAAAVASGGGER